MSHLLILPYCVFDISAIDGRVKLLLAAIDKGTPESIKMGGITADFNIQVAIDGINADFECFITTGNLYKFYKELQECYNNLNGTAVLKYHSEKLTRISVDFKNTGKCTIYGYAQTNSYKRNRIEFCIECDQTYIEPNIKMMEILFDELAALQGFYEFPY